MVEEMDPPPPLAALPADVKELDRAGLRRACRWDAELLADYPARAYARA